MDVFRDCRDWLAGQTVTPYDVVIYSVGENRLSRRECAHCLDHLSRVQPNAIRGVLAADDRQGRLIEHLSPVLLHGVLCKTTPLTTLQAQILSLLRLSASSVAMPAAHRRVGLSPTEKTVLYYMGKGMSIAEIASRMARNAETIRTHKFNVMTKLGASSDTDLLYAADILRYLPFPPENWG